MWEFVNEILRFLAGQDWSALEFTYVLEAAAPTICGVALVRWFLCTKDSSNAIVFVTLAAYLVFK